MTTKLSINRHIWIARVIPFATEIDKKNYGDTPMYIYLYTEYVLRGLQLCGGSSTKESL
jgi:hypothetical protein